MSKEDKFIFDRERELIDKIRRERQLEAVQQEEREGIAKVLSTTEALADEALSLGFDQKTVEILHLVPLIQMAWADNEVTVNERITILKIASERGIASNSVAFEFLELLLLQRPSNHFFERTNNVIVYLLKNSNLKRDAILSQIEDVANASRELFGFGAKINDEEKALIEELKVLFKV